MHFHREFIGLSGIGGQGLGWTIMKSFSWVRILLGCHDPSGKGRPDGLHDLGNNKLEPEPPDLQYWCTLVRDSGWGGPRRGHRVGADAGVSLICLQTPGTTSVSSAPGLSALAATLSSTDVSTLEKNPCSECWGGV